VETDCAETVFTYDPVSHPLSVAAGGAASQPASVTIAGSLQSELGCAGDWDAGCSSTHLTFDAADDAWQGTFSVPAGDWEYRPRSTTAGTRTTARMPRGTVTTSG
jgi:hypothetical protein